MFHSLLMAALKLGIVALIGINVLMKGKPIIAIYLFIKDLFHADKRTFKGYGFWLYCGLGGSGKTISMVEYLMRIKRLYPKVKIYTNFNFKMADGIVKEWQDIIDIENIEYVPVSYSRYKSIEPPYRIAKDGMYFEKVNNGVVFGFDEIHLTFASQNWANCPDNMLEYISQQRKLHKQIVASSQVFTRIDKKLREQTNFVIECSAIFNGRLIFNKFFNTAEYLAAGDQKDSGKKKRKRAKRYSFVGYDSIRKNYDTMQLMKDLAVKKADDTVLLDELLKRLKYM